MSLSKDEQEFSMRQGSRMPQPQPWQPRFHQTSTRYVNDYANGNGNGQELQPCPSGESTQKTGEAVRAKLSNRRRRQRERRALKSKSKANQEDLGQEMECQELGGDQFPKEAGNEMDNGQVPGDDEDTQFPADVHMPMEPLRDIYYP
ncbi:hypothetical protein KR032_003418 [Drosophila birchii]|nr:hypothetical protein KR032_003418 [Drosophila birchii]